MEHRSTCFFHLCLLLHILHFPWSPNATDRIISLTKLLIIQSYFLFVQLKKINGFYAHIRIEAYFPSGSRRKLIIRELWSPTEWDLWFIIYDLWFILAHLGKSRTSFVLIWDFLFVVVFFRATHLKIAQGLFLALSLGVVPGWVPYGCTRDWPRGSQVHTSALPSLLSLQAEIILLMLELSWCLSLWILSLWALECLSFNFIVSQQQKERLKLNNKLLANKSTCLVIHVR